MEEIAGENGALNVFDVELDSQEKKLIDTDEVEIFGRQFSESRHDFSQYDKNFDRIWYCVSGEITLKVVDERIRLEEGDMYRIPKQTSHGNVVCESGSQVLVIRGKFH